MFTRSDNLRSHQRGRGHGVFGGSGEVETSGQGKRRKVSEGEEGM